MTYLTLQLDAQYHFFSCMRMVLLSITWVGGTNGSALTLVRCHALIRRGAADNLWFDIPLFTFHVASLRSAIPPFPFTGLALGVVSSHPNRKIKTKRKNKLVSLLSTVHPKPELGEREKSTSNLYYNKHNGGVNIFDQMYSYYTCRKQTRCCPLCVFMRLVTIAVLNL